MRLFAFLKWWWKNNDWFNRTVFSFLFLWATPCVMATIFVGPKALLCILFGAFIVIGSWALFGIYYSIHNLWKKFDDENPTDEVRVIRKLKGIPTPTPTQASQEWDI
jgi:hypothetical protein